MMVSKQWGHFHLRVNCPFKIAPGPLLRLYLYKMKERVESQGLRQALARINQTGGAEFEMFQSQAASPAVKYDRGPPSGEPGEGPQKHSHQFPTLLQIDLPPFPVLSIYSCQPHSPYTCFMFRHGRQRLWWAAGTPALFHRVWGRGARAEGVAVHPCLVTELRSTTEFVQACWWMLVSVICLLENKLSRLAGSTGNLVKELPYLRILSY